MSDQVAAGGRDVEALALVEEAQAILDRAVDDWWTDGDVALRDASVAAMKKLFGAARSVLRLPPADSDSPDSAVSGVEAQAEAVVSQADATARLSAAHVLIVEALAVDGSPLDAKTLFDLSRALRSAACWQLIVEVNESTAKRQVD